MPKLEYIYATDVNWFLMIKKLYNIDHYPKITDTSALQTIIMKQKTIQAHTLVQETKTSKVPFKVSFILHTTLK